MKQTFLFFVCALFIISCNNDKSNSDKTATDKTATAKRNWSEGDEKHFRRVWEKGSKDKGWSAAETEQYCNCVLDKIEPMYNNFEEAMRSADFPKIKADCNVKGSEKNTTPGGGWSNADKKNFMDHCVAKSSIDKGGTQESCDCIFEKAQQYFSSYEVYKRMSETNPEWIKNGDAYEKAAEECSKKFPRTEAHDN